MTFLEYTTQQSNNGTRNWLWQKLPWDYSLQTLNMRNTTVSKVSAVMTFQAKQPSMLSRKDTFVLMGFCSCHISEHHLQNCNVFNWPNTQVRLCHSWFAKLLDKSKGKYWPVAFHLQVATESVSRGASHQLGAGYNGQWQWSVTSTTVAFFQPKTK